MSLEVTSENNENNEFKKYKKSGYTGLANIGNSCYINSCMQILSHTYEFNDFLDKEEYKKKINQVSDSVILLEWDKLRNLYTIKYIKYFRIIFLYISFIIL